LSNSYICSECGEDQSSNDHAFYHCHDCGECVIFDPRKVIAAREANPTDTIFIGHNFTALPESDIFPDPKSFPTDLNLRKERYAELECVLCCKCADAEILKSHPGYIHEHANEYRDPYAFIGEIDQNKELFEFIKARVDPNAKAVPKRPRPPTSAQFRQFYIDKKKASIIICPVSKCREYCIETGRRSLVNQFLKHLKIVHHLTPNQEFIQKLTDTISYIRDNDKIPYKDPFFHMDYENLLQNLEQEGAK